IITNPPYGERMGDEKEIERLYKSFPLVLRRLPTWSHYILSSRQDLEQLVGQQASRRRKLYNGPIECTYYQFHGPRPPAIGERFQVSGVRCQNSDAEPLTRDTRHPTPSAFGGLQKSAARQAEEFANRLRNRARHFRRWPAKRGITCFRLYERDVPDVPLVVDRYEDALHIAEFARPHDRSAAQNADWLDPIAR